jgi:hypothetical protein
MAGVNLNIGDELVARIAERAAELIYQRQKEAAGDGWLRGADKIAPTSARPGRASTALSRRGESRSTTTARR